MKHYFDFDTPISNCVVAFGRFDGMHIGHRAVLKKLSSYENSVLISFADNYSEIVYTEIEKEFVANSFEIKNMISLKSEIYENMPLSDFVKNYLIEKLNTDTVVVGENYDRLDELEKVCAENNVQVVKIPSVKKNEKEITTELVKTCLKNGDMNECIDLLGKTYVVAGTVVHGKGVGRKYGMPTANLSFASNKIWPKHGVYGTRVHLGDTVLRGMTNAGIRPSDDCNQIPTCETFILDFNGDIYDSLVILEAFTYVRPVMKFSGLEEVRAQIDKDIEKISSFEI